MHAPSSRIKLNAEIGLSGGNDRIVSTLPSLIYHSLPFATLTAVSPVLLSNPLKCFLHFLPFIVSISFPFRCNNDNEKCLAVLLLATFSMISFAYRIRSSNKQATEAAVVDVRILI